MKPFLYAAGAFLVVEYLVGGAVVGGLLLASPQDDTVDALKARIDAAGIGIHITAAVAVYFAWQAGK